MNFKSVISKENPKEFGRVIDASCKIKQLIDVMENHILDPDLEEDPLWEIEDICGHVINKHGISMLKVK